MSNLEASLSNSLGAAIIQLWIVIGACKQEIPSGHRVGRRVKDYRIDILFHAIRHLSGAYRPGDSRVDFDRIGALLEAARLRGELI
jgi:hypothetical protein